MGSGGGSRAVHGLVSCGASPIPTEGAFAQSQGFLQQRWPLGAMCLAMSPHPAELGCASSVTKPADGAPAHSELLQRRLESWASLDRQCWQWPRNAYWPQSLIKDFWSIAQAFLPPNYLTTTELNISSRFSLEC